jgi:transposase
VLGLRADIITLDSEIEALLARTDGQVLTSLPGVATIRAAAFAAHSLPIARFPTLSTGTPRPGWPQRCISPPASAVADGSRVRAWPSTATH